MSLSQSALMFALTYSPDTGVFCHRKNGHGVTAGMQAGRIDSWGHRQIRVYGKRYSAHRLAFLYMTGSWPKQTVDHINGDPDDNRWPNLRDVSTKVNNQNIRRASSKSSTGLLGVSKTRNGERFTSKIQVDGRMKYLGTFDTPEEAHAAHIQAKRIHHEGCTI